LAALVAVLAAVVLVGAGIGLMASVARDLPSVSNLSQFTESSMIYDRYGRPVTTLWGQKAIPVPLSAIPKSVQDAVIATEDHRFYQDSGIDIVGIVRSALADLLHGGAVQGGSTITEQLAKIHYLSNEKTITRKIKEVLLGLEIAHAYTKAEILDDYLNQVYLGQGAFGVDAASLTYFGKPVSQVTLAQAALLAGLPQAPSYYDPFTNLKAAKARQWQVLENMVRYGYITQAEADAAYRAPLGLVRPNETAAYKYPYFVDAVVEDLLKKGFSMDEILNGGLQIYTTLDPRYQKAAEDAVAKVMNPAFGTPNPLSTPEPEAAVAVVDPHNGYVLALVGGRTHPGVLLENRATQMYRQTGSAIKPLAEYSAALAEGLTEGTVVDDIPFMLVNGRPWPQNDDHIYRGRITYKDAIAFSDNNAAVRVLERVGLDAAFNFATQKYGLPLIASGPRNDRNLAFGIGGLTRGVTPLEMADAYATFDNHGVRPVPILVTKVVAPDGNVLFQATPRAVPVLTPQQAYIMTDMLEAVVQYGTGVPAQIGRPVAGKTGTSENGRDGWFIGYTPQAVAAVWEGYDDGRPQPGVFGATYAAPIWRDLMAEALAGQPVENFARPPGIVTVAIDTKSGDLPSPLTPPAFVKPYLFIQGTQPTQVSNVWVQATVDALHPNLLWAPDCLPDPPETKVFLERPTDLMPHEPLPVDAKLWVPTKYCDGQAGGGQGPGTTPGQGQGQGPGPSGQGQGQGQAVTLQTVIRSGALSPPALTVPAGASVTWVVQNQDAVDYTFSTNAFALQGSAQDIPAGQSAVFTFPAPAPGTYTFQLAPTGGGPPLTGTLTVSSPPSNGQGGPGGANTGPTTGGSGSP
jgi:penicillin-binding protein 1A